MSRDRERALVARARDDNAALGELCASYLPRIYAFVYRRVRDRSVTEALTTAAFRQALEASRRPDLRSESFSGLLYRAAATGLADRSEQSRRANPLGDLDPAHQNLSDNLALDSFLSAVDGQPLHRGLLSLPEQHRELLVMRYYDDLDNDELCAVLSCSREVLAGRLHRALRALQLALASESADVA